MHQNHDERSGRYVYRTQGVCSPEIHFRLSRNAVHDVRFVGGGCPGNARLAARLMEGRPIQDVLESAAGIQCRNATSCPDQLALGISSALDGKLPQVCPFRIHEDATARTRIGLIGGPGGSPDTFMGALASMEKHRVESVYVLGNLVGPRPEEMPAVLPESKVLFAVLGERDWACLKEPPPEAFPKLPVQTEWLEALPHALSFRMGGRTGFAFYGRYLQTLEGYSDFDPFALEINLICDLADFMDNADAYSALEAMIPQFSARIVVFGQKGQWGFWRIGEAFFVSVGDGRGNGGPAWGLLEARGSEIDFRVVHDS